MVFSRCLKCRRKLQTKESKELGYGPFCYRLVCKRELILLKGKTSTIENADEALKTRIKIFEAIDNLPYPSNTCLCGTLLRQGVLCSYDHENGYKAKGWKVPQWFYIHCEECDSDTSLDKIKIDHKAIFDEA